MSFSSSNDTMPPHLVDMHTRDTTTIPVIKETKEEEIDVGNYVGKCKWFSERAGYGFITVESGDRKGAEIFVHHTEINPQNRTRGSMSNIFCGEYVTFDIIQSVKDVQAVNVRGIKGGPLLYESNPSLRHLHSKPIQFPHNSSAAAPQHVGNTIGICKWFNNKLGYGFITVLDGEHANKDIFVHHSGIKPMFSMYKALLCGEYVQFDIVQGTQDIQAVNVTGMGGGTLICDQLTFELRGMMLSQLILTDTWSLSCSEK